VITGGDYILIRAEVGRRKPSKSQIGKAVNVVLRRSGHHMLLRSSERVNVISASVDSLRKNMLHGIS
jgi:hypothetical protein